MAEDGDKEGTTRTAVADPGKWSVPARLACRSRSLTTGDEDEAFRCLDVRTVQETKQKTLQPLQSLEGHCARALDHGSCE